MTENIESNNNGIVKMMVNGVEHTFWTHANVVRKYIKNDLRKKYPDRLIAKEFNDIDYIILEENLPVEIQATIVQSNGRGISYASWEDRIKRQIEQDIISYGRCSFYFDSELLRAMKNAGHCISINMDWFRKYMKEEKLDVSTVNHNGIVEVNKYKDFDFIVDISQSCPIAADKDDRILNNNKMKIFDSVLKWYDFSQDDIDKFEDDYEKSNKADSGSYIYTFLIRQPDERSKLYGNVLKSLGHLSAINEAFNGNIIGNNFLQYGVSLGIFESEGISGGKHDHIMRFVDRSNSAQLFPAYLRHKDKWDEFKGKWLTTKQMESIIKGIIDYNWYKKYENNGQYQINNDISREIDKDQEVNIKIDNKDQIININIKTEQKTIEDSWS